MSTRVRQLGHPIRHKKRGASYINTSQGVAGRQWVWYRHRTHGPSEALSASWAATSEVTWLLPGSIGAEVFDCTVKILLVHLALARGRPSGLLQALAKLYVAPIFVLANSSLLRPVWTAPRRSRPSNLADCAVSPWFDMQLLAVRTYEFPPAGPARNASRRVDEVASRCFRRLWGKRHNATVTVSTGIMAPPSHIHWIVISSSSVVNVPQGPGLDHFRQPSPGRTSNNLTISPLMNIEDIDLDGCGNIMIVEKSGDKRFNQRVGLRSFDHNVVSGCHHRISPTASMFIEVSTRQHVAHIMSNERYTTMCINALLENTLGRGVPRASPDHNRSGLRYL